MTDLTLQYLGFLNTPNLWIGNTVYGLDQFNIPSKASILNITNTKSLRLGKLVERFVLHQLHQERSSLVLAENIQIQNDKLTLGELDCLFNHYEECIHLEVVYKFYLYDNTRGHDELSHWIGPNQKDSLLQKLNKLKEKQFPLLYSEYTKPSLEALRLKAEQIKQYTCFKAQLFIPYGQKTPQFKTINPKCIKGFYMRYQTLSQFTDCKFYIPKKLDWLKDIQIHINWKTYIEFTEELHHLLNKKKAPLCWVKLPNGETQKWFIIWW